MRYRDQSFGLSLGLVNIDFVAIRSAGSCHKVRQRPAAQPRLARLLDRFPGWPETTGTDRPSHSLPVPDTMTTRSDCPTIDRLNDNDGSRVPAEDRSVGWLAGLRGRPHKIADGVEGSVQGGRGGAQPGQAAVRPGSEVG